MTFIPVDQTLLDACAREPIRIPGGIQPHGGLIVVDPASLEVLQASRNIVDVTGLLLGPGADLAGTELGDDLKAWADSGEPLLLRTAPFGARQLQMSGYRSAQGLVVEFERAPSSRAETLEAVYPRLQRFVGVLEKAVSIVDVATQTVREIRALTGFDRTLLYSFEANGDGTVVAEDGNGVLPSYFDLRFPASDLPAQARQLYTMNRLRLIPNVDYTPVPIEPSRSPLDGEPLDLSSASLRSVSPIHLEYMRNMGTAASMSISIVVDDALWGLISCHNKAPRHLNPQIRTACDFVGQIVSLQIGARSRAAAAARRIELKHVESELLTSLSAHPSFERELQRNGAGWLRLVAADGAAFVTESKTVTYGKTPGDEDLQALAAWLQTQGGGDMFVTDCLSQAWRPADNFAEIASGMLAISISQIYPSYILWFRQELVRTVRWGGDPRKDFTADRLHPRKSFEIWKQQVRRKSAPWGEVEIESARDFRNAIVNFVLRRAEERAALSDKLQRSNAELEAFSYSVSHDLRAPFRHIAGYAALLSDREKSLDSLSRHYIDQILEATISAGQLVDDLLNFSQLGRASLDCSRVDMRKLITEVKRSRARDIDGRDVDWQIGELPNAWGDGSMLRQVWANLIDNALKYSQARQTTIITISGEDMPTETRYRISDNGVGFDMAYVNKLFGVFQRLHRSEEFPGTGIGLALVKRIVDRHGGTVTAHGELNRGATFTFAIPKKDVEGERG